MLFVIVLVTGEPITWYWLLVIPALMLQTLFNVGGGLLLARWGAGFDDVSQLLPFIVRTWMYASGVLFSIQALGLQARRRPEEPPAVAYLMQINPAAVYITLISNALLTSQRLSMPGSETLQRPCLRPVPLPARQVPVQQRFCHPIVAMPGLWWYGAGWACSPP